MNFLRNQFVEILRKLGFYQKRFKIIFLGLENSGKSSLLHRLIDESMQCQSPSGPLLQYEFAIGTTRFLSVDLGGYWNGRRHWRDYLGNVDGYIFMVDSADRDRFAQAAQQLWELLQLQGTSTTPFVILGNKTDLQGACSAEQLTHSLDLSTFQNYQDYSGMRPVKVFMCSVAQKSGYVEAFRWLIQVTENLKTT